MLFSVAIMMVFGLLGGALFKLFKLPPLLGMLGVGMILGPYGLNLFDADFLLLSADLRMFALILILLRAGLGLKRKELKVVGKTALFMSVIPGLLEGFSVALFAMWLFDFSFLQGAILGFIIAAVSPAVVVPGMLKLIERKVGNKKKIPVMILAAASVDDVVAITMFTMFLGLYLGVTQPLLVSILGIPLAIILGIVIGVLVGLMLVTVFTRFHVRDTVKIMIILAMGMLIVELEHALEGIVMIASLIGVMALGLTIVEKKKILAERLALKLSKLWVFAEVLLFVLVGAAVNIPLAFEAGVLGVVLIFLALIMRSTGVWIATYKSGYTSKERLFVMGAYTPKATVQAAIGSVPLTFGVSGGDLMLTLAVLSIIISAPLGALLIEGLSRRLLDQNVG